MGEPVEPTQHFYESQRLKLSYWSWGDPTTPPLFIYHGARDHARSFDRVARAFCDRYHVITPDLRGHGDSEWAIGGYYGMPEQVLDMARLIELHGGRGHVVAHSMGARVALYAAGTFPEHFRSLVTIEGASLTAGSRFARRPLADPEQLRRWARRASSFEGQQPKLYRTLEEARERMMEADARLSPEFALHLTRYAMREVDGGYVWKFDNWVRGRQSDEISSDSVRGFWEAVECPVLQIVGGDSHFGKHMQSEQDLRWFRDARYLSVPDAGHWVHHDQLDAVVQAVASFLDDVEGSEREIEDDR